jgi:hypothetical protein
MWTGGMQMNVLLVEITRRRTLPLLANEISNMSERISFSADHSSVHSAFVGRQ